MSRGFHIEPLLVYWLEEHLPTLVRDDNQITHKCFHCGRDIHYPLIARQADVQAFQEMLAIAGKYLEDSGAMGSMLVEIAKRIEEGLAIQEAEQICLTSQSTPTAGQEVDGENEAGPGCGG